MNSKVCLICNVMLPLEAFSMNRGKYYHSYCRECDCLKAKERRNNNVKKTIITRCKSRAKQRNIAFDISEDDLFIPEVCPILGIPLVINNTRLEDNSISVDRIDPHKGYVKGNIQIISQRANRIKTDASIEEIEKVLTFMRKK